MGRWARKPVNHTSWVAVVTPTDRPKSVRNRCLIELFCGVVCVVTLPFWHFCWCRGFCHRTESDLFLFLISSIITNLQAECIKLQNCKCCALRGSLNMMAPNFELCCLSLSQFHRNSWYVLQFYTRQFMHSFGKFCSFRNGVCIFLVLYPKKQTEQKFYESFRVQGFRLDLNVLKEHLHINRLSFCL